MMMILSEKWKCQSNPTFAFIDIEAEITRFLKINKVLEKGN